MKQNAETYNTIHSKVVHCIECASGKYPTLSGIRVNDDIFAVITTVTKNGPNARKYEWALIFVESDLRGGFYIRLNGDLHLHKSNVVSKSRGKEYAADRFTNIIIDKMVEEARR